MLHSKLESEVKLAKDVELIEALRDIETHEGESMAQCLTAEYREILKNEKQLLARYNKQPGYLDRLFGKWETLNTQFTGSTTSISNICI